LVRPRRIVAKRGAVFNLGYGVLLHAATDENSIDLARAYQACCKLAAREDMNAAPSRPSP